MSIVAHKNIITQTTILKLNNCNTINIVWSGQQGSSYYLRLTSNQEWQ